MSLWPFGKKDTGELTSEQRSALSAIVRNTKFELIPLKGVQDQVAQLPPKSTVTVTASPTKGMEVTMDLAESIAAMGHDVIPHFSARLMRDRAQLTTLIARDFTVTRGQLQYFGTPDLDAALDIEARHVVRRLAPEEADLTMLLVDRWLGWYFAEFPLGRRLPGAAGTRRWVELPANETLHTIVRLVDSPARGAGEIRAALDEIRKEALAIFPSAAGILAEVLIDSVERR